MRKRRDRGFVLPTALWLVAALATLAMVFARYADNVAFATRLSTDDLRLAAAERAAVEMAAYRLIESSAAHKARGDFVFSLQGVDIAVSYVTEAARVDLNGAPVEAFARLFGALGATGPQAQAAADQISAWRKKTAGDDPDRAYADAGLAYRPRHSPFQDPLELALVAGLPSDLVARALPYITVYGGNGKIDPRVAAPIVLASLPGLDGDKLAQVLAARSKADAQDEIWLEAMGKARAFVTTTPNAAWRILIDARPEHGRSRRAEAVIAPTPLEAEPYRTLAWSQD